MSRILSIDYGGKRTGLAVTDPLKIIATGLCTVETPKLLSFLKDYFSKEPVELVIAQQEGLLTLYSNAPGFTRELRMPEGVTIESVLPEVEGADGSQPRRVVFIPGATVPGISIQLVNRRNAHRRIRLDPMTGFPRVDGGEAK